MSADDAAHQSVMAKVVQSAALAVALPGGIDQRQVARRALAGFLLCLHKARLQRHRNLLGKTDADKATGGHRVAVVDQAHRLGCADHLVAARAGGDAGH